MRKEILPLILIATVFAIAFYVYPSMPETMPIHWNAEGEIDGYGSRFIGVFLLPLAMLGVFILLLAIPRIAVFKENIKEFEPYLYWFRIVFILFMSFIYLSSLMPNFGFRFNMTRFVMIAIGFLFFFIGFIVQNVKRNYFIGFRTPWTLSSDKVWKKTHEVGGKLFMLLTPVCIFVAFFPKFFWFFMVSIFGLVIWTFLYSYILFKKEK